MIHSKSNKLAPSPDFPQVEEPPVCSLFPNQADHTNLHEHNETTNQNH